MRDKDNRKKVGDALKDVHKKGLDLKEIAADWVGDKNKAVEKGEEDKMRYS